MLEVPKNRTKVGAHETELMSDGSSHEDTSRKRSDGRASDQLDTGVAAVQVGALSSNNRRQPLVVREHGEDEGSETPSRIIGLSVEWSEVFAFLTVKDVVALLTAMRNVLVPRFFLSTAHKRNVLALALHDAPTKYHTQATILAGTVELTRPLTLNALRHFVAFVKAVPAEIKRRNLDWICDDKWKVAGGNCLTCTHVASGMSLSVECTVCGGDNDDTACGTLVLTLCSECSLIRNECSTCCGKCDSCKEAVCRACVIQDPTTDKTMCGNCGYICVSCNMLCSVDDGSASCAGATDDQPCPHNHGMLCTECNDIINY